MQMIGLLSLAVFIAVIILGMKSKVNLGILAIAASFLLGFLVEFDGGTMSSTELKGTPITSSFPFSIFWMTISVSLMLGIGNVNGFFDVVIKKMVGLVHGKRALIPICIFFIMFFACSVGAGSTGTIVLLCTIAATVAKDQDIDPVFMLLSVLCGSAVAIGSPVGTIGIVCNSYSEELWGETIAPSYMYPRAAIMSVLSFAVIYLLFRGWSLESQKQKIKKEKILLTLKQKITLGGFLLFILLAIVLGFDIGLSAFLVSAILLLLGCADEKKVLSEMPWSSILLISGMCILIGVVKAAGGMDLLTNALSRLMTPYTVKPLYSLLGSILSMVSTITGVVLPSIIPTIPDIAIKTGVNPYSLVTALAFGGNVTCASPISALGAIALGVMSSNPNWDSKVLFKRMFLYSLLLMGVAALWAAIGIAG